MQKYILASGCSYTDDDFTSLLYPDYDTSYDKWPSILGEKLELPVKNIARSGVGNDYIFNKTVEDISKNYKNIELVVIGWTEAWRWCVFDYEYHNPMSGLTKTRKGGVQDYNVMSIPYYKHLFIDNLINQSPYKGSYLYRMCAEDLFSKIIAIQNLCKAFGIKLIMSTLCGCFNRNGMKTLYAALGMDPTKHDYSVDSTAIALMQCKNFYDVDKSTIIGWPFVDLLGGFEFNFGILLEHLRIGEGDGHPNKKGHKLIADYYYEHYQKIYL
jgi:hypothetical protein